MKASMRISLFGTGLLVLSAGMLMAQEAGTRDTGRDQGQERTTQTDTSRRDAVRGDAAQVDQGARAGNETRMLIGHAVSMAIRGTTLKGQAEQAGGMGADGQGGAQAGQAQPAGAAGAAPAQAGTQGGRADTGARAGAGGDPAQELMTHARKEIQDSRRLLQGAGGDQGSMQQLYKAADGYINTLLALSGDSSTMQDAGAARAGDAATEAGRARTGRSSRDEDLGAAQAGRQGMTLSARDKAAVTLINHAVCEVIEGTLLTNSLQSQGAVNSAASEMLQRHAREMTTEGRETLQRFLGSTQTGAAGAANPDTNAARTETRGDATQTAGGQPGDTAQPAGGRAADATRGVGGQAGEASVMTLAQRGQELIQAFQDGGHGGAQGDHRRTGATAPANDGAATGTNRGADAASPTNPR